MLRHFTPLLLASLCAVTPACDTSTANENPVEDARHLTPAFLGTRAEARSFLSSADATVWSEGLSLDDIGRFIDDMYAAGVVEASFAGIEEFEGSRISAWLVFELPDDAASRARCFERYNEQLDSLDEPPITDGQQAMIDLTLD